MPVSGISRVTPPTMTNTWRASRKERPPASSLENGSLTDIAARSPPPRPIQDEGLTQVVTLK